MTGGKREHLQTLECKGIALVEKKKGLSISIWGSILGLLLNHPLTQVPTTFAQKVTTTQKNTILTLVPKKISIK